MKIPQRFGRLAGILGGLALIAASLPSVTAASDFPRLAVWAFPGAWQDSTLQFPNRCGGQFRGPRPDSVREQPRTITVRFLRDRVAETRTDFGGYRIYRVTGRVDATTGLADTARMVLVRRYSVNAGDALTWNFSHPVPVADSLPLICNGRLAFDSVLTFVDPDSSGAYIKMCRRTDPPNDPKGRCLTVGDSIFKLVPPPGPHDGFRTWYSVTYEAKNLTDNNFEDLFIADTTSIIGPCFGPPPGGCYNLNNKLVNSVSVALEPTGGPATNLENVGVVPNPYRATEAWDTANGHEVHFVNLPVKAKILIYTVSGDLVAQLEHNDTVRDFERWNLKNQNGQDVASGIYVYRVVSDALSFQHRFVVIR